MDNVIAIDLPAGDAAVQPRIRRLRSGSQLLARAITLALGGIALFSAAILVCGAFFGDSLLSMGPGSSYLGDPPPGLLGVVPFGALPLPTRLAYAATLMLNTAPVLFALFHLRALLRRYADGIVFAAENGWHIKQVALGLVGYAIAPFLGHQLVVLAGHGVDLAWFHASEVQALILGAVLLVIAQVMEVGREIEQDRDGFV